MFDSYAKPIGHNYTTTVALFCTPFCVSLAVLVASRSFGYVPLSLAGACSAICIIVAWALWKRSPGYPVPAVVARSSGK
jgi:hypothetical protein